MRPEMKRWLHDHGLTASRVANVARISYPNLYRQLSGRMKPDPALRDALISVFGMTVQEFREAVP